MDNEKENPNNAEQSIVSETDSIDVNNLLTLTDSDITPDLLKQLEMRAQEEQAKLDEVDVREEKQEPKAENQENIDIPTGLPEEEGAISITGEITEKPIPQEEEQKKEEQMDPLEEAKMNAAYKKYVIYIDRGNEKFIDSLSLDERKTLINTVLHEQNELSEAQRAEQKRAETITKIFIAIITFIIAVPIIYFIFNVSLEATIQNYRHSKSNFEVLYKETGKIKVRR